MDQLKTYLKWLRTYHFWVLTVIILIAGVATWSMASADLAKQFERNRGTIKTRHSKLNKVKKTELHPNLQIVEARNEQREELAVELADIWRRLYEQQRQTVLVWPKGLLPAFHAEIRSKQFGDDITSENCNRYLDFVRRHFLSLAEIVDAKPIDKSKPPRRLDRARDNDAFNLGREPQDEDLEAEAHLVAWPKQSLLLERLIRKRRLSGLEVWVMQEDFWAYETMLRIIAKMNEGASGPHNAKVREIQAIEVGGEAAPHCRTANRVQRLGGVRSEGSSGGMQGRFSRSPEQELGGSLKQIEEELLHNRYLDDSGVPLAALKFKKAKDQEFKRLPVRMKLIMDQRDIPLLLIECANADLPIEVQQVRMNAQSPNRDAKPYEDHVIIQGIIYLFNSPDYKALGVEPPAKPSPAKPSPAA